MKYQVWKSGEDLVANVDTSKSNITDKRKSQLLDSLIKDTTNLMNGSKAAYGEYPNSDLDSCTLRLKQNIDQLKKIKNSFIED